MFPPRSVCGYTHHCELENCVLVRMDLKQGDFRKSAKYNSKKNLYSKGILIFCFKRVLECTSCCNKPFRALHFCPMVETWHVVPKCYAGDNVHHERILIAQGDICVLCKSIKTNLIVLAYLENNGTNGGGLFCRRSILLL